MHNNNCMSKNEARRLCMKMLCAYYVFTCVGKHANVDTLVYTYAQHPQHNNTVVTTVYNQQVKHDDFIFM